MTSIATTVQNREVGQRLAVIRAEIGFSQNAFADSLGISPHTYANYERGTRETPSALLRTLLEVHGIDPVWVLAGPEPNAVHAVERRLNLALLEEVVRMVERSLHHAGKKLSPDKKARLIRLAYERCMHGGKTDARGIRDLLLLAA